MLQEEFVVNILAIAHYGIYADYSFSFVHTQMRAYVKQGNRVRVIVPVAWGKFCNGTKSKFGTPVTWCNVDDVEVCYLRILSLSNLGDRIKWNIPSAISALKWNRQKIFDDFVPDVVHAHTLGLDSEMGAWVQKRYHVPLVVTTHGSDTNVPLENGETVLLKKYCDEADAVVAVSKRLRMNLARCKTETPLHVIHNGFVPYRFSEERICKRNPYAMIQVGNLIASKRVDVTIQALARLREKWPDMVLTVIGEGPLRQQLEELSVQLGVADAVRFLGQIPNAEVFERLCESTYFVMASKPEGFGIVYLEAMAAQCVTVGTENEGIADLIEHGKNGFLVPADDPQRIAALIDDCLHNSESAREIAINGRKSAEGLTWDANAEKYVKLFRQLIGNASKDA